MTALLFYVLAFIFTFVVTSLSVAVAWTIVERRSGSEASGNSAASGVGRYTLLRNEALSTLSTYNLILSRVRFVPKLKRLLDQANVDWSVASFLCVAIAQR